MLIKNLLEDMTDGSTTDEAIPIANVCLLGTTFAFILAYEHVRSTRLF